MKALESKVAKLEQELEKAHAVIDIKKKLCTLFGLPSASDTDNVS